jgi:hypothetical protein
MRLAAKVAWSLVKRSTLRHLHSHPSGNFQGLHTGGPAETEGCRPDVTQGMRTFRSVRTNSFWVRLDQGMSDDFYTTVATVLPVLLLALIWDSRSLENIRRQERKLRKVDPVNGVRFWTKRRFRLYTLFVATAIVIAVGLCILELGGAVPNRLPLRVFLMVAVVLTLATLVTRICVDVIAATAEQLPAPGVVKTACAGGGAGDPEPGRSG